MTKVQIGIPARHRDDFLSWLQEEQVLHLAPLTTPQASPATEDTAYTLARIQSALEFLQRVRTETHTHERRSWRHLFAHKPAVSLKELEAVLASLDVPRLLDDVYEASEQLTQLAARAEALTAELAQYEPWRALAVTGRDRTQTRVAEQHLLIISGTEYERFIELLEQVPTALWQEVARVTDKKRELVYLEVIVHERDRAALQQLTEEMSATTVTLALEESESLAQRVERRREELEQVKEQRAAILQSAQQLLAHEYSLQLAYDALLHQLEQEQVRDLTQTSDFTFMTAGWMPEAGVEMFEKLLVDAFPAAALERIAPDDAESPPILFQNSKLMAPFEAVTNIYGKPRYTELDPSPVLSLFFLAAFGMALTDAGYGFIMMGATWAANKFFRLKRDMRQMVHLLFYAGGATVIIGALTGGWFGLTLEELPASPLRGALLSIKLIDPVQEPITLLVVALALGILQLLFAWGVKGYDLWRRGEWFAAVVDSGAWITLVVGILAWTGMRQGIIPAAWQPVVTWFIALNAAVLVLTQGRQYKNIYLRLGSGVLSLYGLVSFLSDVLSYSRLLALGLATAIIGLVVNLIGAMAYEMVPVVGFVLAGAVLLVGHAFNIGINSLGAFIHSGRLQFVEFFPKFMEGGGLAYKPFGRVGKYVENPRDFD